MITLNSKEFKDYEQETVAIYRKLGWAKRAAEHRAFHETIRHFQEKGIQLTLD